MLTAEKPVIRWGILGTGKIAHDFSENLTQVPGAIKQAVFSRNSQNAINFANKFDFLTNYQTLQEFFQDPDIDIVYIATPTALHKEHCLLAIENGKAVLCEKPFTLDWQSAHQVIEASRAKNLFCMEAMWLRFNPLIQECKSRIAAGEIGDICSLNLEIGYRKNLSQLRTTEQGRGVMHRFGCYGLSLAFFLFGKPQSYKSHIVRNEAGIDIIGAVLLCYPSHTVSITAGIKGTNSNEVRIVGSVGSIKIPSPFIDPQNLYVSKDNLQSAGFIQKLGNKIKRVAQPLFSRFSSKSKLTGSGFRGEITESMNCLDQGLQESEIMPLDESLTIHRLLDDILQVETSS